ncbi:trimeric intracellular cation channel family protein [Leptolyngbya sp. AN02str]|uniref:trimeric intracellular cation channel family protein n=1 Tax=Leptolyngbya sp. AN02str TaxID=3423363 RepID=UPI003D3233F8
MTREIFLAIVEWASVFVYALSGIVEARKRNLDLFGALVIGFVTAFGGGTLRDVLLGRHPLYWTQHPIYIATVVITAILALFFPFQADKRTRRLIIVLDALGLGLFSYLGTYHAITYSTHMLVAPIMGMITATFGGVIRDVFFSEIPQIFLLRTQLYAVCALLGAFVYVLLRMLETDNSIAMLMCVTSTFLMRMLAIKHNLRLPL